MTGVKGARIARLSGSRDIRHLRKAGRFSRGGLVHVWASPDAPEGDSPPSLCVVTGRGFGRAVDRNRAKRRVRGCVMEMRHILEPGRSYLVECRPGVERADYQLLVNELGKALAGYSICRTE